MRYLTLLLQGFSMKTISRALIIGAAITAAHNAYAVDIDIDTDTTSTWDGIPNVWEEAEYKVECEQFTKSKYPMVEQYAPARMQEVCQRPSIIPCPECEAAERIFWCAKKIGKSLDGLKKNPKLYYYCEQCFSLDNHNQELVIKIIDAIGHKVPLSYDETFALYQEFNQAVAQAQKDGDQERAKSIQELTHPN
jgi:hypothetical protein